MEKGNKVKIIGGNYEKGCIIIKGKIGIIDSIDNMGIIYVWVAGGLHCFNNYHLEELQNDTISK